MNLTLADIRRRTASARELMRRSRAEGFAVGAFNIDNQETLQAISQAAKQESKRKRGFCVKETCVITRRPAAGSSRRSLPAATMNGGEKIAPTSGSGRFNNSAALAGSFARLCGGREARRI